MKDVIIIGGGISGLAAGYKLQKDDIDFQILESSDKIGGVIETLNINDFLIETGPYTFSSTNLDLLELIRELEITDDLISASSSSKNRYVYLNRELMPVPANILDFFKTNIISQRGKQTLLEDLIIEKEEKEETVEDFITRRFGREILKNLIQPYLNGVFAGDVKKLSALSVFPFLKELEDKYKSVLLGFLISSLLKKRSKLNLYSFKEGMGFLSHKLHERIKNKVTTGAKDIEVTRAKDCFIVYFKSNNKVIQYPTSSVLFATPAYKVLDYSHLFPNQHLTEIFHTEYMPICVVSQVIDKSKLKTGLEGFGFLCTKEPHRKLLGTIYSSSIFPNRAPKDKILLTSFIGGASYKKIVDHTEEEIKNIVIKELSEILGITDSNFLETLHLKVHLQAIPQYYLGHSERVKKIEDFMKKNYGLFFCGNYLHGISMNDTIKSSKQAALRIKTFINKAVKRQELVLSKD